MFQSTRPVRGATPSMSSKTRKSRCFNPRAPCGARPHLRHRSVGATGFQSTRPVRGATAVSAAIDRPAAVSIHAPRAGRDRPPSARGRAGWCFNPRAPCGARQPSRLSRRLMYLAFQSTRPVRGATAAIVLLLADAVVSIHAPRAGRDTWIIRQWAAMTCFNPRAPCGARPPLTHLLHHSGLFQSTRPVRGATGAAGGQCARLAVSIHAPRAGRDRPKAGTVAAGGGVSIHAPRAGRDRRPLHHRQHLRLVSIHAPRAGRDGTWPKPP